MDPLVIVSPHLDDAVLSAGQMMAGRPECVVVTLFAGCGPNKQRLTTYDRDCGFRAASGAVQGRRLEDIAALGKLRAQHVHLPFPDEQYEASPSDAQVTAALWEVLAPYGAVVLLGPLGLAHPDHHRARRAVHELAVQRPEIELWLYEEQPYRVLSPELVPDAFAWWSGMGWNATLSFLGDGPLSRKDEAIDCYASQLWALNRHACRVPERHWRMSR